MRDVKGSTSEEIRMIKAIQRSVGALENGWIGNQTLSDIAAKLGAAVSGEMARYRQELRDIPKQEGFPYSVVFPTMPRHDQ